MRRGEIENADEDGNQQNPEKCQVGGNVEFHLNSSAALDPMGSLFLAENWAVRPFTLSLWIMEVLVNSFRQLLADSIDLGQGFYAGSFQLLYATELP